MKTVGAVGVVTLLVEKDAEGERDLRHIHLEAREGGKTLNLVDVDARKAGTPRETRYDITPAELIACIRRLGRELPHEIAVPGTHSAPKSTQAMRPLDAQRASPAHAEESDAPALAALPAQAADQQVDATPEGR